MIKKTKEKIQSRITSRITAQRAIISVVIIGIWVASNSYLFINFSEKSKAASMFIILTILFIAALFDVFTGFIPIKLIPFSIVAEAIYLCIFHTKENIRNSITGCVVALLLMTILKLLSRGHIGNGDFVVITLTGFFTNLNSIITIIFFSVVLTGIYSLILMITGKGNKMTEIPFIPFILIATTFTILK